MKAICFVSIAVSLLLWECHTATQPIADSQNRREPIAVRLKTVRPVTGTEPIVATGLLTPRREVRLSFKVGGIIQRLYVQPGESVRAGQLLATLNPTELNAQVEQANQLYTKAERDWQRTQRLYRDSVATLEQLQNQTTALETSRQTLLLARANQGQTRLYATLSGVVQARPVNEGELVAPGAPVVTLTSTSQSDWVLRVGIADKAWTRLHVGDPAQVLLDAVGNQPLNAQVVALSQGADPASGLYQADLQVRAEKHRLVAGLFGKATLYPRQRDQLLAIPVDAIVEGDDEKAFAYVLNGDVAHKQPLNVLYIRDNEAFVRLTGQAITSVITDGSAYLEEGSPVQIEP
jgi:RND family efflux transporter MFP subunit